jgi:phage terminase large subunit-like protein
MMELIDGVPRAARHRPPPPLERYCPHHPWSKQRTFLDLCCKEAFYGGAAAGGKSESLLMAALQYAHVPGYAALILRKDTQRLSLSGGLIPRSHEWLTGKGPVYNSRDRRWTFETNGSPATISFGYLQDSRDKYRYGSSEYQFIAFDELTEFPEDDYLFLFSRLRKTTDLNVPLRMRSASNPGNLGHGWVKRRFIPTDIGLTSTDGGEVHWLAGRAYVPARIRDNPAVDEAEYRDSLEHLPTIVRERLMNGDWSISERGLIQQAWLRYYTRQGSQIQLCDRDDRVFTQVAERTCRRFVTVDPAGTSADRARERRGRPPSWSVAQVWDVPAEEGHARFLLLRDVRRKRVGFDGLCRELRDVNQQWRPERLLIENEKLGQAARDILGHEMPLECIATGGRDKVTRAAPLINKLEKGEIFLPKLNNGWLAALEAEWLAWTGLPEEVSDQIDAAAYAAAEIERYSRPVIQIDPPYIR